MNYDELLEQQNTSISAAESTAANLYTSNNDNNINNCYISGSHGDELENNGQLGEENEKVKQQKLSFLPPLANYNGVEMDNDTDDSIKFCCRLTKTTHEVDDSDSNMGSPIMAEGMTKSGCLDQHQKIGATQTLLDENMTAIPATDDQEVSTGPTTATSTTTSQLLATAYARVISMHQEQRVMLVFF